MFSWSAVTGENVSVERCEMLKCFSWSVVTHENVSVECRDNLRYRRLSPNPHPSTPTLRLMSRINPRAIPRPKSQFYHTTYNPQRHLQLQLQRIRCFSPNPRPTTHNPFFIRRFSLTANHTPDNLKPTADTPLP